MSVWGLVQERMSRKFFSSNEASSGRHEATLSAFFSQVTQPIAEMLEALYVAPLQREVWTIEEIARRMARSVEMVALPYNVVTGVCCSFWHRRASSLSHNQIEVQETTWHLSWQQPSVQVRAIQGISRPFLLLVTEEPTGKILAFRSISQMPEEADVLLLFSDALAFATGDSWHLHPPAHLRVQRPLPPQMVQVGKSWGMEVEEGEPQVLSFVQQWEQELRDRVLDPLQYLRLFDRACERTFAYAPFLRKQRAARRHGWQMQVYDDPSWILPDLRDILPIYEATVGSDGTILWRGWHYRDMENDVLRYWPEEAVAIRHSPVSEALIWVYWRGDILCCAIAEELHHKNGSYRPYWFPYSRLGE
jgi:hypothetical protein